MTYHYWPGGGFPEGLFAKGSRSATDLFGGITGSGAACEFPEEARLDELAELTFDWDLHGSEAPSDQTIGFARLVLRVLRNAVIADGDMWVSPHMTASEDGEIVFEWWVGVRKLTVYCGERNVQYIRVWGADIDSEMDEGLIGSPSDFRRLWNWLRA